MKNKKLSLKIAILTLILAIFIINGCDLISLNKSNLSNQTNSPENSALALQFGDLAILPPTEINSSLIEKLPAKFKVHLEWKRAPGAMEYLIFRSSHEKHSYEVIGNSIDCSFSDEIGDGYSKIYYKIKTKNSKGTVSRFSDLKEINLIPTYTYDGKITQGYSTAGDFKILKIEWLPLYSAKSYRIERDISGRNFSKSVLVEESFYPNSLSTSLVTYNDTEAESGLMFDYRITPISKNGVVSSHSLILQKAWVTPTPFDLSASCGHALRGMDGSTEYSIIELNWKMLTRLRDANGLTETTAPISKWILHCKYRPNETAETIDNIVEGTSNNYLKVLSKPSQSDLWISDKLEKGYTQNDGSQFVGNGKELFYKTDSKNEALQHFKMRIKVRDTNISDDAQFNESWYKYYYFQITGLRIAGESSFETSPTQEVTGYAADPIETNTLEGLETPTKLNFRAEYQSGDNGITLLWNGNQIIWTWGTSNTTYKYCIIYKLNDANQKYEQIQTLPRGEENSSWKDTKVTKGKAYRYRIAFKADNNYSPCEATQFKEIFYE